MSVEDDDPAHRRTIKEMPTQRLEDFEAPDETDPEHRGPPAAAPPLPIEVELVHERGVSDKPGRWRAFEVWTAKSVYAIDGQMLCTGVMDRATGRKDEKHSFLGARLMGGERKLEGAMTFSHPLPIPGSDAIFQIKSATRGRYGHTSPVEKVVVRIRVTHAPVDTGDNVWEEITKTFPPIPG